MKVMKQITITKTKSRKGKKRKKNKSNLVQKASSHIFIHMLIYVHSLCSRSGIPKRKALSDLNSCYNFLFHSNSNKVMHNNTPLLFLCNLKFAFLHRAWTMSPEQSQYIWRKTIPQIEVGMGSGVFTSHRSARFVLISD